MFHGEGAPYPKSDILRELSPGRLQPLLDLGCGTGATARELAPLAAKVDTLDLSSAMIQ